jgi:hypothetical protein
VQTYCAAAPAMSSTAECNSALQAYLDHVRPDVAGMAPLAGRIDDHMMAMGTMPAGDMRCGMDEMSHEIDRHAGVACASGDMNVNRAESVGHRGTMEGYIDHMQMRGMEAAGMMGGGMMSGGMMGGAPDGGWMMSDGGMMGWDHHLAGCPGGGG